MTANEFAERMLQIRSKWQRETKDASEREAQVRALAEQMVSLGFNPETDRHRYLSDLKEGDLEFAERCERQAREASRRATAEFMGWQFSAFDGIELKGWP